MVVDGDLIGFIVPGLCKSRELGKEVSKFMFQCIKVSIKMGQLVSIVSIKSTKFPFKESNLGVKISNVSHELIDPKLVGTGPFKVKKTVLLVSTFARPFPYDVFIEPHDLICIPFNFRDELLIFQLVALSSLVPM